MKKVIKIKAICPIEFAELNPTDFFYLADENKPKTLLMRTISRGTHFNSCSITSGYLYEFPDDVKVIKIEKENLTKILKKTLDK
ncbi:MAG: hypothetical protein KBS41_03630 [Oscillospiraceae bacterium]|nr:hypothetical protein [Candidatus Equicaccousia limihippi]